MGPGPEPLERDAFVASAVPEITVVADECCVPRDGAPLGAHLDEIARFYACLPEWGKWGAWIDPANTDDAKALTDRGLVLDSTPRVDGGRARATSHSGTNSEVESASVAGVGAVNDVAYNLSGGMIASRSARSPQTRCVRYGIRVEGELASVAMIVDVGRRRVRDDGRHAPAPPWQAPRLEAPRPSAPRGESNAT